VDSVHSTSLIVPPDSRLQDRSKGSVRGEFGAHGSINWVPIFCANCGKPNGYVPEENMSFVCWLCNDCSVKCGPELSTMMIPDEIFWQTVRHEQLERYGRLLDPKELHAVAESSCTPLSTLLREKR
jgi:hypothetical protein